MDFYSRWFFFFFFKLREIFTRQESSEVRSSGPLLGHGPISLTTEKLKTSGSGSKIPENARKEMSVFGGDSWAREAQYRKRRVDDLVVQGFDGSSYMKLSNGKYACLVCPHNPVLDSSLMLSVSILRTCPSQSSSSLLIKI